MEEAKPPAGRGGPGRGQGRKPLADETTRYCFLMTPAQRAKLEELGGAHFLRQQIDAAKPKPKPDS